MGQLSGQAREHFLNPRNVGPLENPDAIGQMGIPGQGNYMIIHIKCRGERIADATFQTYGCPGAICCGSAVTELAKGLTISEAAKIDAKKVLAAVEGLPMGRRHCAGLAAGALKDALDKINRPSDKTAADPDPSTVWHTA